MDTSYSVNSNNKSRLPILQNKNSGSRPIRLSYQQQRLMPDTKKQNINYSPSPIMEKYLDSDSELETFTGCNNDTICKSLTCQFMHECLFMNCDSDEFKLSFEKCLQRLFPNFDN